MKRENLNLLMKINATISLVHVAFSAVRRIANTVWTVHLVEGPFVANTASSLLLQASHMQICGYSSLRILSSSDRLDGDCW